MKMNNTHIRIAHISDVHIRMKDRHEEYQEVFDRLYKMLREDNPDRIFLGGDIVHSKISLSPELVQLTRSFLMNLADIAAVDLIAGNHDMNVSNLDRMDALTPIVNSIGKDYGYGINYMREGGFYEVDGEPLVYGVYSLIDGKPTRLTKKDREEGKFYVAAYHGPVAGCLLENEYEFSEASMSLRSFGGYDFVFLGDIHKCQGLGNPKVETIDEYLTGEELEKLRNDPNVEDIEIIDE